MEGLREKTIRGLSWSLVDNLAGSGMTFLIGLVLARILSPEDFGVAGILLIFITLAGSVVDSGLSNALIRKRDASEQDYNTVFYVNLVLALAMYAVLFFLAPVMARYFDTPVLLPTLRVLSVILFFNAFSIVQRTKLVKQVDFRTQAWISIIASLASAFVGIGLAWMGLGVWALVGQLLGRYGVNALLLWIYNRWRPRFIFSWQSFRALFGFGSRLLLSSLLDTIYLNVYQLVIGKYYSRASLGQYTRAQQFQIIFAGNLTAVIQRVTYPVLSQIQDDEARLREAYRRVIVQAMVLSFACLLVLAAMAKPLVLLLIGVKWLPAVGYLQIICFSGMLFPLHALNMNVLQVKGRSDLFLRLEVIRAMLGVVPIVVGIYCGIVAMLIGTVVVGVVVFFFGTHFSGRLIGYRTWAQLCDLALPFILSLVVASVVWTLTLTSLPVFGMLVLQLLLALSLLPALYFVFSRHIFDELIHIGRIVRSYMKY